MDLYKTKTQLQSLFMNKKYKEKLLDITPLIILNFIKKYQKNQDLLQEQKLKEEKGLVWNLLDLQATV